MNDRYLAKHTQSTIITAAFHYAECRISLLFLYCHALYIMLNVIMLNRIALKFCIVRFFMLQPSIRQENTWYCVYITKTIQ